MQTLEQRIPRIWDHKDYWTQLQKDMLAATARVTIQSPFISKNGIDRWEPLLLELKRRGIFVRVIVCKPKLYDRKDRQDAAADAERRQFDALVARLKTLASEVIVRKDIHAKFALIDAHLIWEGSLNFLSHWETTEHLRRTTDLEDIKEITMRHELTDAGNSPDPAKEIGAKLKEVREKQGINQYQAAKLLGTTHPVLSRIERGESNVVHPIAAGLTQLLSLRLMLIPEYLCDSVNQLIEKAEKRQG